MTPCPKNENHSSPQDCASCPQGCQSALAQEGCLHSSQLNPQLGWLGAQPQAFQDSVWEQQGGASPGSLSQTPHTCSVVPSFIHFFVPSFIDLLLPSFPP